MTGKVLMAAEDEGDTATKGLDEVQVDDDEDEEDDEMVVVGVTTTLDAAAVGCKNGAELDDG